MNEHLIQILRIDPNDIADAHSRQNTAFDPTQDRALGDTHAACDLGQAQHRRWCIEGCIYFFTSFFVTFFAVGFADFFAVALLDWPGLTCARHSSEHVTVPFAAVCQPSSSSRLVI